MSKIIIYKGVKYTKVADDAEMLQNAQQQVTQIKSMFATEVRAAQSASTSGLIRFVEHLNAIIKNLKLLEKDTPSIKGSRNMIEKYKDRVQTLISKYNAVK